MMMMIIMSMMMIIIIIIILLAIIIIDPFGSSDSTEINPKRFLSILIRYYNKGSMRPILL
jgi:uncharacterized membrane protein